MSRNILNALTDDSQKKLIEWEKQLPDWTYARYTTEPETGDFTLVATAYKGDDTVYNRAIFESTRNMTAILDEVIAKLEKNGPSCSI